MTWSIDTSCGFESRKIKYLLPRYTRGRGLEIGCGQEKAYAHFIGVDNGHHFGKGAADIVCEADDLAMFAADSMDFVFSSHVLEHMTDMRKALNEWGRVIKPGGFLVLYVPSADHYPRCGEEGANPDHKHDIYKGDIPRLMSQTPFAWDQIVKEERSEGDEYSLFEVYLKIANDPAEEYAHREQPMGKTACVVRYGGFGDMLQAAAVLPELKKLGYHVTVMTTPKGQEILQHDPNVDDFYLQDPDQVPNNELPAFWAMQAKRFDKFVNLSESIEGYLLAMPGRTNHAWPLEVRQQKLNCNYMDWTAALAGVTFKPCRLFYPTDEELIAAQSLLNRHVKPMTEGEMYWSHNFNIVWALAGSSIHKFYPHMDQVIARVMLEIPQARIFLTGDYACKLLEQGWEQEPRVVLLSGEQSIRDTLSLALIADCVVGPETGVLNAVAYEKDVGKVVMLSHSSPNNLTKYWLKTTVVTDRGKLCPESPCHRLHYGNEFCHTDEMTGAALCAIGCDPEDVFRGILKAYDSWRRS
jgi:ADP-heptose:LPS heptosyltransferase